mgnify:CR=1 FL=1
MLQKILQAVTGTFQLSSNNAMISTNGGIDLSSDKSLIVQNNGQGIKFHLDPAQLEALQNATGFVPVIINIQPMKDVRTWLGLNTIINNK